MGACASFAVPAAVGPATELRDPVGDTGSLFSLSNLSSKQSTKWKFRLSRTEALEMFEAEGSIPEDVSDDELLLRVCLDDPLFLYRIGHFSKKAGRKFELLLCWADILEFKAIDVQTSDFLVSKAIFIFQKYVKDKSAIQLDLQLPAEWVDNLEATLHSASRGKIIVAIHIFDSFQQMVLRKINEKLFQEYKLSDSYGHTLRDMRRQYNQVKPEDFVYLSKLGQGTNGLVVQAVKKSTGKLYALKIQPKSKLLDSFVDDPSRVMSERNVVLSCNHPFVISMHYSFQTPSTVFMAMDLGTGGTLHSALFGCKMGGMSEARIRFYCAEVVLALNHMHQLGLIYRDLKLQNVVLNEKGHIRLIDLGEAVNVMKSQRGVPVGKDTFLFTHSRAASDHIGSNAEVSLTNNSGHSKRSEKSVIEKFVNSFAPLKRTNSLSVMLNPSRKSRDLSTHIKLVRALSIVGTNGYMAPELAALEHPNVKDFLQKVGYTKAVDYWALGVMAYQLFTGTMPFEHVDVMYFSESVSRGEVHPQYKYALDVLANSNMAPAFLSFVTDVLQIDESERLGAGAHGFLRLKRHPFFEPIHWTMLGQQQVTPPFLPPANVDYEDDVQYDYDNFLQKMNLTDFAGQVPSYEEQEHFSHWDYISPTTLKAEMGLVLEMEASDAMMRDKSLSWGANSARHSMMYSSRSFGDTTSSPRRVGVGTNVLQTIMSERVSINAGACSTIGNGTNTLENLPSLRTSSRYNDSGKNASNIKRYYSEVVTTTTGISEDNQKVLALSRNVPPTAASVLKSLQDQPVGKTPVSSYLEGENPV